MLQHASIQDTCDFSGLESKQTKQKNWDGLWAMASLPLSSWRTHEDAGIREEEHELGQLGFL